MSIVLLVTLIVGILAGWLDGAHLVVPDLVESAIFSLMLLFIGIDIGSDRQLFSRLRQAGWRVLLFPTNVVVGTLVGCLLAALMMHTGIGATMAIGAGYGWYSLAALLLNELDGARVAAVAFLANLFREILGFVFIPLVIHLRSGAVAMGIGGATTMDTTLPLFTRGSSSETTVYAFVNGVLLSALVPLAVPLLYRL